MTRRGTSRELRAVDADAAEHRPPGATGLVRLLAHEVLDAEHVGDRQVAMVALELLGQRRPAEQRAAEQLGHLAELVLVRGSADVAGQLRAR